MTADGMGSEIPEAVTQALANYLAALRAHACAIVALIDGSVEFSRDDLVRLDESFERLDVAESAYRYACARFWG